MHTLDQQLMNEIQEALYKHGKLSLLFYKMDDAWIIHKWGEYSRLEAIHEKLFEKYKQAGFIDEANSLTIMELPSDEELIYKILNCQHLPTVLKQLGLRDIDAV